MGLIELSAELLHCILCEIDPPDLARLSETCHLLHSYIKGNRLLHKDLYERCYDELPEASHRDWEDEIHKVVKLEKILQSEDRDVKREHLAFVAEQVNSLLETAEIDVEESRNIQLLSDYFENQNNIDVFLCSSSLFSRAGTDMQEAAPTTALQQASAKLHCLYGRPVDPIPSKHCSSSYAISAFFTIRHIHVEGSPAAGTRQQTRGVPAHMVARSKVYDLREYTDDTLWGPFMDDGSQNVDWEKVEAVMLVLGFNLSRFTERSDGRFPMLWDRPFDGATPKSYVSTPISIDQETEVDEELHSIRELSPTIDDLDPYGVTGTWMRVVCFLDYNDLYAFNFTGNIPNDQPRMPIDTQEGTIDLEEFVRPCTQHQTER